MLRSSSPRISEGLAIDPLPATASSERVDYPNLNHTGLHGA